MEFDKQIEVRWADCDANRHVRHSAYYDFGAHCRIKFFTELGYDAAKLSQMNIGPILFKEECNFIKELKAEDTITVKLLRGNISADGGRWELHHEILNGKGEKSAHISTKGAWRDLAKRKLTIPPQDLVAHIQSLPEGDFYVYKKSK